MKHPLQLMLAILALFLGISQARAVSTIHQIKPGQTEANGFGIEIKSDRLKDGQVLFRVSVSAKESKLIASLGSPSLGIVTITDGSKGYSSQSIKGTRSLAWEKSEQSFSCTFTISEKELTASDLSFVFERSYSPMPAVDFYCVKLKNSYKP